jgi:hypothetical protein
VISRQRLKAGEGAKKPRLVLRTAMAFLVTVLIVLVLGR